MEEIRNLVSVREITNILPIPDADRIEVAVVDGWEVVVGRGEFAVGDRVVFFEIDSALPLSDYRFSFLTERGKKTLGDGNDYHVLKTIRLRGHYSQGLIMPESILGTGTVDDLGVIKYERPEPTIVNAKGNFPTHILNKTDATRVQNLTSKFNRIAAHEAGWYPTLKYDGSSMTAIINNGEVRICSRNLEIKVTDDLPQYVALKAAGLDTMDGYILQGEYFGEGLQKNPHHKIGQDIRVFNVFSWDGTGRATLLHRKEWPEAALHKAVEILDISFPTSVEAALIQAEGLKIPGTNFSAEGIVWHTNDASTLQFLDDRDCFKVINNRYLLKN